MSKLCIVSDGEFLAENVIEGVTSFVVTKRNPVFFGGENSSRYYNKGKRKEGDDRKSDESNEE